MRGITERPHNIMYNEYLRSNITITEHSLLWLQCRCGVSSDLVVSYCDNISIFGSEEMVAYLGSR